MPNRIYTRINLFPNLSVRFLRYVSTKQPTVKNTATNHATATDLTTHQPPHRSCHRHRHRHLCRRCRHHCCRPCRHRHCPCCCCSCCCRHPRLTSLPSLPSSSMSLSLTLLSSSPVILTILAGHPYRHCRRPHCRRPCRHRRPRPLLLPALPVVIVVLAISSSAAFG